MYYVVDKELSGWTQLERCGQQLYVQVGPVMSGVPSGLSLETPRS